MSPHGSRSQITLSTRSAIALWGAHSLGRNCIAVLEFRSGTPSWLIALLFLCASIAPRICGQEYTAVNLGTKGAAFATGINNNGQVVGWLKTGRAFLYSGMTMTDLGTLGGDHSYAYGINNKGQIVGQAETANGLRVAFLYGGGNMIGLGTLGGDSSNAYAINNTSAVAGTAGNAAGFGRAFLYTVGPMIDLGNIDLSADTCGLYTPGTGNNYAYAINDSLQIVGSAEDYYTGEWHPFLDSAGSMMQPVDLGTFPGAARLYATESICGRMVQVQQYFGSATGINNSGQIVGTASDASYNSKAFLYNGGTMMNLGTLGGLTSYADGINNTAQVVGRADTASGESHAFLYRGGSMLDLNNVVTLPIGVYLTEAFAINDLGQLVASGSDGNPYLLTPGSCQMNVTLSMREISSSSPPVRESTHKLRHPLEPLFRLP